MFKELFERGAGVLLIKRLLREQERTADALERLERTLSALGQVMARAHGQNWERLTARTAGAAAEPDEDHSMVSYLDDQFLADIERVERDYWQRFGRQVTEEEAIAVLAEERAALEGRG